MYADVEKWINNVLVQEIPETVIAFCFNLYEEGSDNWSMELVGTERFDEEDEDWRCDEITDFGTRECLFTWHKSAKWDVVLGDMIATLNEYLSVGKYAHILKSKTAVGVGFVDGDAEILYTE